MKLWVTGWGGMLGDCVLRAAAQKGHGVRGTQHKDCPIDNAARVWEVSEAWKPDAIINCAGKPPGTEPLEMIAANTMGPHALASTRRRLIHMSTDAVAAPDIYSRSKLAGESDLPHVLNVRGTFIGREAGFLRWLLEQEGKVDGWTQALWNGTTVAVMAEKLVELAEGDRTGIVNVASTESVTKAWLVGYFKEALDLSITIRKTAKPRIQRVLESDIPLPPLTEALGELVKNIKAEEKECAPA